jgi:prophage DNA circulation protein
MTLVTTQIEALLPDAADASYAALRDLKLAVVADITARAADLKIITHYTPGETLPALVIAHALYGSADLEANVDDLVARNQIQNPGAVPGGRALEVLTP